ncbi:MAG: FtsQ-type POTRA domain-containing protein [Oscillospiraceae bacterium]|nr:FtsQ-type POTRA domain-containing protein [Oscillospiraceae bacterium]
MAVHVRKKKVYADDDTHFSLRETLSSLSGPIMFFLVIVAVIFVMSVFFRVSDIQVVGNAHYTDEEIIRAIDIEEGDNLFFFDRFAALSRVFAKLPYIDEVSVERSLPNKVIITVTESQALAYIVLGEEKWTIDHSCKVLGKANDDELAGLIPIEGIDPGTLMIGEPLQTADGDDEIVNYIAEVLYQLEARGLYNQVEHVDFSDPRNVEFRYADKYTIRIGDSSNVEYKFGMVMSVLSQLMEGDVGIINVSNGSTAVFSPN